MNYDFENESLKQDIAYGDIKSLNDDLKRNDNLCLYVNIRSLNANFENLKILIERLKVKPYVIVCAETWNLEHCQYYRLNGYNLYYNESKINKSDGVVIYIKKNIKQTTEIIEIGKLKILNTEIILSNEKHLQISSMYRSHDLNCCEFILNVKNYLKAKRNVKNHFIIGDFNINIINNEITSEEFLNNFLENGFLPGFTSVTRPYDINTESGTCIDNIFIKTNNEIDTNTFKLSIPTPDHFPLFVNVKRSRPKIEEDNCVTKVYDYKKLEKIASRTNWNVTETGNPNKAINSIIEKIQKCLENSEVVMHKKNKKDRSVPRKNWITKAIIKSCNKKEALYKEVKAEPNNENLKNKYKNYVKILNKIIKDAKINYEKKIVEQNIDNQRNLWKVINNKIGNDRKEKGTNIREIITNDNEIVKDQKEIVNIMNTHYCKMGEDMSKKISIPKNKKISLPPINEKSIFLKPTDNHEVISIIDNLKNKNGGVDRISAKTLKTISSHISETLANIFNNCIEQSIWPDALKKAEVIPIYKSGKKHIIENYRPISLISNIAKIFEKIIYNRLSDFITKNNLLSSKQFGFTKKKGTKDALSYITSKIYENLDKSTPIAVTFIDLAKAFDTVNHEILLDKLYSYGIRGKAYDLLESYLKNRKQKVRIGQNSSDFKNINTGVPQGTILGPLLFIIYVNDLLTNMPNNIVSYADDTAIIAIGKKWEDVEAIMNKYLEEVSIWLALNKLTLNVKKTVYITFGNYCDSVPKDLNIIINNEKIQKVDNYKYLGIVLDFNLKWKEHIEYTINRTRYLIFVFHKLSKIMNTNTLKMIYYALIHSKLSYGNIAWGGAYKSNLQLLQNIQNRILKKVYKNFFPQNKPLNMLQIFALESLKYNYNELRNIYINSKSITRQKIIPLPRIYKTVSEKNHKIKAIRIFNKLPNDLKDLEITKKATNKKLKEWIMDNI